MLLRKSQELRGAGVPRRAEQPQGVVWPGLGEGAEGVLHPHPCCQICWEEGRARERNMVSKRLGLVMPLPMLPL